MEQKQMGLLVFTIRRYLFIYTWTMIYFEKEKLKKDICKLNNFVGLKANVKLTSFASFGIMVIESN